MDKDWRLAFAFFILLYDSPEVMNLISSDNFDVDYAKSVKELECIDSDKLKKLIINKVKESKEKMKAINEAYIGMSNEVIHKV